MKAPSTRLICKRCGGRMNTDRDGETSCYVCGYYHYTEAELEVARAHAERDMSKGARKATHAGSDLQ